MNYFVLAGAIVAGLIALRAILVIFTVATGKKRYAHPGSGFFFNALWASVFGTLAAWLLTVAIG